MRFGRVIRIRRVRTRLLSLSRRRGWINNAVMGQLEVLDTDRRCFRGSQDDLQGVLMVDVNGL
jgi:hypothetical protein